MGKTVGVRLMTLSMCSWVKLDKTCVFCCSFSWMLGPVVLSCSYFSQSGNVDAKKNMSKQPKRQVPLKLWGTDVLSHGRSIRGISLPGHSRPHNRTPKTIPKKLGWMNINEHTPYNPCKVYLRWFLWEMSADIPYMHCKGTVRGRNPAPVEGTVVYYRFSRHSPSVVFIFFQPNPWGSLGASYFDGFFLKMGWNFNHQLSSVHFTLVGCL